MDIFKQTAKELMDFISASPTGFHAVAEAVKMLKEAGFQELSEGAHWELVPGASYYVIRNDSSLAAFRMPRGKACNYQIIASHCDSPFFKIKQNPEIGNKDGYVELNVEKYGSALLSPWFDRPLGIAGRMITEEEGHIRSVLTDSGRPLALIPSLAIHMDRSANEKASNKIQSDMLPVFGCSEAAGSFVPVMAKAAGIDPEQVIGYDLFLYNRCEPSFWGADEEFFSCPRLDNLQNLFASVKALISSELPADGSDRPGEQPVCVCSIFDHEEVGSKTKQGADSTFLRDVLERIRLCLGLSEEDQQILLSESFLVSADNGHAVHPNHPEKADPVNRPSLNGGVLIKHSAIQKYTTDAVTASIFRSICKREGIPVQDFTNHADIPGGGTLGSLSASHVSINSIDIGCAQLAMHSPYETGGTKDVHYMTEAMKAFYQTVIRKEADGGYSFNSLL